MRTRVIVCDDSPVFAAALRRVLEHDGDIEVAAVCATAEDALAVLPELQPDLVTMDVELPGMSGLEAVEQIMGASPLPILVLSSHVGADPELAAAALAAGALDAVAKGDLDLTQPDGAVGAAFRHRAKLLSRARVIRHPRSRLKPRPPSPRASGRTAGAIGIVASTGGPQTLAVLLAALPATFPLPVFVVQHISAGFTEGLTAWLDGAVPLPVQLGRDGARGRRGIWIAPEGAHLVLRADGTMTLDRTTVAGPHRPSGDVLLRSLADSFGAGAVAVVLSGMGRDGTAGAVAVREAGGLVVAQDEETSAVYGMPKAAADSGAALVLPPREIAAQLRALRPARRTT
jgi:two-component system chemotaxis response regulator CheB